MTEMLTQSGGGKYNIHFKTDNPEAYKTVQEICRLYINKEKQTPKKPTHEATLFKSNTCPCCKNVVDESVTISGIKHRVLTPHCKMCGQALDWSDTE